MRTSPFARNRRIEAQRAASPCGYCPHWLIVASVLALVGCQDKSDSTGEGVVPLPDRAMREDGVPDSAPHEQDAALEPDQYAPDFACEAILAEDGPEGCPAGQLLGPDGQCYGEWDCLPGWEQVGDYGCRPGLDAECPDGTWPLPGERCTLPWLCVAPWVPIDDELPGCMPPPLPEDCPAGSMPLVTGQCSDVWICPPGWERVEGERGCLPPEDCGAGTLLAPDGTCARLWEEPCPMDHWGELGETRDALFVDPAAPAGGDGSSSQRPIASLVDALRNAAGRHVILARGRHRLEPSDTLVTVPPGTLVTGVCPDGAVIEGSLRLSDGTTLERVTVEASGGRPSITVEGAGITLRRARLHGGEKGLVVQPAGSVELYGVEVLASEGTGLHVLGQIPAAERVIISETVGSGILIDTESNVAMSQVVVRDVSPDPDETLSYGIHVIEGGVHLEHLVVDRVDRGLTLEDGATRADIGRAIFKPRPECLRLIVNFDDACTAILLRPGASLSVRDSVLAGWHPAAAILNGAATLERVFIDGRNVPRGLLQSGILVVDDADVTAHDLSAVRLPGAGVSVVGAEIGAPPHLRASQISIRGMGLASSSTAGPPPSGIEALGRVQVSLRDVRLVDVERAGLTADEATIQMAGGSRITGPARLDIGGMQISGAATPDDGVVPTRGMHIGRNVEVRGSMISVRGFHEAAVAVGPAAECLLQHLAIHGPGQSDESIGEIALGVPGGCNVEDVYIDGTSQGIVVGHPDQAGAARLRGDRVALRNITGKGGVLASATAQATLSRVSVRDAALIAGLAGRLEVDNAHIRHEAEHIESPEDPLFRGVLAEAGGHVSMSDSWVESSARIAVGAIGASRISVHHTVLRGDNSRGRYFEIVDGSHLQLSDSQMRGQRSGAVFVEKASASLERVAVENSEEVVQIDGRAGQIEAIWTPAQPGEVIAPGFEDPRSTRLELRDIWLANTPASGIVVTDGATVVGERVTIGPAGGDRRLVEGIAAIRVEDESLARLDRVALWASRGHGVLATDGPDVILSRARIAEWTQNVASVFPPVALRANANATIRLHGGHISDGPGLGVVASDGGSQVNLQGVRVENVSLHDPTSDPPGVTLPSGIPVRTEIGRIEVKDGRFLGSHGPVVTNDGGAVRGSCIRTSGGPGPAVQTIGGDTTFERFYIGDVDGVCVDLDEGQVTLNDGSLSACVCGMHWPGEVDLVQDVGDECI